MTWENEQETLDKLPGEGETETITRVRIRICCDNCGEPAHFKYTFLLPNARSNPASSGYGGDDISRCSDAEQYSCRNKECIREMRRMDGYGWCSMYPANKHFARMFLTWEESDAQQDDNATPNRR